MVCKRFHRLPEVGLSLNLKLRRLGEGEGSAKNTRWAPAESTAALTLLGGVSSVTRLQIAEYVPKC